MLCTLELIAVPALKFAIPGDYDCSIYLLETFFR